VYSTCIFCHSDLGKNESVEHFPIGRRLAFDAARGRLWVVCRKCERWNLTPLDERWEAIEECERLFTGTKLRVSTDEIGLARVRDGLELVRIGKPQRPEMAAWRYGDQFGRRRRRNIVMANTLGAATLAVILYGTTGIGLGVVVPAYNGAMWIVNMRAMRKTMARVPLGGTGELGTVRAHMLRDVRIAPEGDDWSLAVTYDLEPSGMTKIASWISGPPKRVALLQGDDALRAAGQILPALNVAGGKSKDVTSAVDLIERSDNAHTLFNRLIPSKKAGYGQPVTRTTRSVPLVGLPVSVRLALEMMTHEDAERRALEGELHILEAAWKDAEEIASISDDLLVSDGDAQRLSSMKQGR
jgi:hypothetical protein